MRQGSLASIGVIGAALAVALASAVLADAAETSKGFGLDDFQLRSTQDLLDICTLDKSNPSYFEARAFCYGYFKGGADFHKALTSGSKYPPIACPAPGVTARDVVAVFVAYANAHPEYLSEDPMDTAFRAVIAKWPCPAIRASGTKPATKQGG
jgi:hypothetical protein